MIFAVTAAAVIFSTPLKEDFTYQYPYSEEVFFDDGDSSSVGVIWRKGDADEFHSGFVYFHMRNAYGKGKPSYLLGAGPNDVVGTFSCDIVNDTIGKKRSITHAFQLKADSYQLDKTREMGPKSDNDAEGFGADPQTWSSWNVHCENFKLVKLERFIENRYYEIYPTNQWVLEIKRRDENKGKVKEDVQTTNTQMSEQRRKELQILANEAELRAEALYESTQSNLDFYSKQMDQLNQDIAAGRSYIGFVPTFSTTAYSMPSTDQAFASSMATDISSNYAAMASRDKDPIQATLHSNMSQIFMNMSATAYTDPNMSNPAYASAVRDAMNQSAKMQMDEVRTQQFIEQAAPAIAAGMMIIFDSFSAGQAEYEARKAARPYELIRNDLVGCAKHPNTKVEDVLIAAQIQSPVELKKFKKDDLTRPDARGMSPIHHAALRGWTVAVRNLIAAGASAGTQDPVGRNPLTYAITSGQLGTASYLASLGCSANAKEKAAMTVDGEINQGGQPLTPLNYVKEDRSTWRSVIEASAHLKGADKDFDTALQAVLDENMQALDTIFHKNPKIASAKDKSGWTLLHYAAAANRINPILFLVGAGADLEAETPSGATPLIASISGVCQEQAARALVGSGANLTASDKLDRDCAALIPEKLRSALVPDLKRLAYDVKHFDIPAFSK